MSRCGYAIGIAFLLLTVVTAGAFGQSTAFTYQGRLTDAGAPASALHDFRFRLFDAAAGGAQVGATLCLDNVNVAAGLFTVQLDFGQQFATIAQRHLEIEVRHDTGLNCTNLAGFVLLAPRQQLTAAPKALFSLDADRLDGLDSAAFLQSIPVPLALSGTSGTHIIRGENASTTGGALGVFGLASAISGSTVGMRGQSNSTDGIGVVGVADFATGATIGVYGQSSGTNGGVGVRGNALAPSGTTYGVRGLSLSPDGRGVVGEATAATGVNYGVFGSTLSPNGFAGYYTGPAGSRNYFERDVGIGTTAPAAKLDVRGDIRLGPTGQYRALAGEENLRIIRGRVGFDGVALIGAAFFSSTRLSQGVYQVTFTTPFASTPTVTAIVRGGLVGGNEDANEYVVTIRGNEPTAGSVKFNVRLAGCCAADRDVDFVAIGPR